MLDSPTRAAAADAAATPTFLRLPERTGGGSGSGLVERARRGEILPLTSLRGVAAIMVLFHHANMETLFGRWLGPPDGSLLGNLLKNSYLFTDLFFILSGFVIARSNLHQVGFAKDVPPFLVKRVARIFPLHLFCLGLFLAFEFVKIVVGRGTSAFHDPAFAERLLANATLTHVWWDSRTTFNWPSWSLSAEFAAYLAFAAFALVPGARRMGFPLVLAALLGLAGASVAFGASAGDLDFFRLSRGVFGFLLGVGVHNAFGREDGVRPGSAVASDLALALAASSLVLIMALDWADILTIPVFALVIVGLVRNGAASARALSTRTAVFFGDISYSVYLMQAIWLTAFVTSLELLGESATPGAAAVAAAACVLSLVPLSYASYRMVEVPGRRWVLRRGAALLGSAGRG